MNDTTKTARRIELEAMRDDQLLGLIVERKLHDKNVKSRDDAIALIERHEEQAAKTASEKQPAHSRPPRTAKSKRRAGSTELTGEQIDAVRKVWTNFARDLPRPALSAGHHEIDKDARKQAEDYGVPDGDYRVSGADWILSFEDGRFIGATRGGPNADPASYATVPADEGHA